MSRVSKLGCSECSFSYREGAYLVLEAGASAVLVVLRVQDTSSSAFKIVADFFTGFFSWGAFKHGVLLFQPKEERTSLLTGGSRGRQRQVLERIDLLLRAISPTIFFSLTQAGVNFLKTTKGTYIATVASAGVFFREELLTFGRAAYRCRPTVARGSRIHTRGSESGPYSRILESSSQGGGGSIEISGPEFSSVADSEEVPSLEERNKKALCKEVDLIALAILSVLSFGMTKVAKETVLKKVLEFLTVYFPSNLVGRGLQRLSNLSEKGEKVSIVVSSFSPYLVAGGFAPIIGLHRDVSENLTYLAAVFSGFAQGYEARLLKERIKGGIEHLPEFRNTKIVPFSDKKEETWKKYFQNKISWLEGSSCYKIAGSIAKLVASLTFFCLPLTALGGFSIWQIKVAESKTDVEAMAALLAGCVLGTLVGWSLAISSHSQGEVANISYARRVLNYLFKKLFVFPDIFYLNPAILYYVMLSIMKLNSEAIQGASNEKQGLVMLGYFSLGFCSTLDTFRKMGISGFNWEQPPDIYTLQIIATLTYFFSSEEGTYE